MHSISNLMLVQTKLTVPLRHYQDRDKEFQSTVGVSAHQAEYFSKTLAYKTEIQDFKVVVSAHETFVSQTLPQPL